jgi:type II secretory pathway pseudopilin PulG
MRKKEKGFTLLEILIGVMLIILVLAFAFTALKFSNTVEGDIEEAAKVCNVLETASERVMSMARSTSYYDSITSDLENQASMFTDLLPYYGSGSSGDFRDEQIDVAVTDLDDDGDLKQVTITYEWKPRGRIIFNSSGLEIRKSDSITLYVSRPAG